MVSVILSEVEGSTNKTFYNNLTDRPFDYAQGDRDIMNRGANITVKVLADTNNKEKTLTGDRFVWNMANCLHIVISLLSV